MDSQKKDESRDHRREEALARRMGDALDRLAQGNTGECPDAELIAAYHENSLAPDEIGRLEGHFAICGRCRKILAGLAASRGIGSGHAHYGAPTCQSGALAHAMAGSGDRYCSCTGCLVCDAAALAYGGPKSCGNLS